MKKLLILIAVATIWLPSFAQQAVQRSQYMYNNFIINPAYAGVEDGIPISFNFRRQWTGIDDAPVTQSLSANAYTGKFMGIGLTLSNDVTGPTRQTGMSLSFARHLKMSDRDNNWLSFGLAGSFYSYSFDLSKLTFDDPNDPAINGSFYNEFTPDVNFGVYFSTDDFYVGGSISNMLQTKTDLFNLDAEHGNQLLRTYFITSGYQLHLSDQFILEPSFLFKYTANGTSQIDINAKLGITDRFWTGASYRINDAIVGFVGLNLHIFEMVYSYDYTVSDINQFSGGTHEISITTRLESPLGRGDDDFTGPRRPKYNFNTRSKRRPRRK